MQQDPYTYPDSEILINRFDIKNQDELYRVEAQFIKLRMEQGLPSGPLNIKHYRDVHEHLFKDTYAWAGQIRTVNISKGGSQFALTQYIESCLEKTFSDLKNENYLKQTQREEFCKKTSYYFNEINAIHAFREGNGRTQRAFFDLVADNAGFVIHWENMNRMEYTNASIAGFNGDLEMMENLLLKTTKELSLELNNTQQQEISLSPKEQSLVDEFLKLEAALENTRFPNSARNDLQRFAAKISSQPLFIKHIDEFDHNIAVRIQQHTNTRQLEHSQERSLQY